jgi:serine/threonine protein kinase
MPLTLTCPHGHVWDAAEDTAVGDSRPMLKCPVCGSDTARETVNQSSAESQTDGDQLPPPPAMKIPAPTLLQLDSRPDIPGFEILDELGRGGMGVVYRARQKSLGRVVALKMLLAGPLAGGEDLARLRSEAESIARLQHPNIVHVYDIGEHQGWTFISLEFLEGGNLAKTLDGRPRTPVEAAELIETLARAVHAAHQRGVVHRDLKPANVLLTSDGTPKITDFGLAKRIDMEVGQTRTGAVMGTPCYMAPEQAEGKSKSIGPATDVYALGAMLYELLTGRPPFHSDSAFGIMMQVVNNDPVPPRRLQPGLPQALEQICLKCLNKDPGQRYPSALALAEELKRFRLEPQVSTSPSSLDPKPARRSKSGGYLLVGLLAIAGASLLIYHFSGSPPNGAGVPNSSPAGGAVSGNGKPATGESTPAVVTPGRTKAKGDSWSIVTIGSPDEKFDRIAFPSRTVGFAASRQGLYKTADGGKTWSSLSMTTGGRVHVLFFQDESDGWLGTDRLLRTADGGATWQLVPLPSGESIAAVTALAFDANGLGLAGGTAKDGSLLLFRRLGAAAPWQAQDASTTGWWGKDQRCQKWYVGEIAFRAPSAAVATLFRGSADEGVVLATVSGGESWSEQFGSPVDLYRVRFANAKRGWLVGNCGKIWHTDDSGNTWNSAKVSDFDEVAASALALTPNGLLAVAPLWQGEVLVTTDGQTWRKINLGDGFGYSMPSVAVFDDGFVIVLSADGRIAMSRLR